MPARFLTRGQVAEELNITMALTYALIRRGDFVRPRSVAVAITASAGVT